MKERGKFIVIEGLDGSGKTKQFKLLKQRLRSIRNKLITTDFPRYYESKWGELVGRFLIGEFGKLEEVPGLVMANGIQGIRPIKARFGHFY